MAEITSDIAYIILLWIRFIFTFYRFFFFNGVIRKGIFVLIFIETIHRYKYTKYNVYFIRTTCIQYPSKDIGFDK